MSAGITLHPTTPAAWTTIVSSTKAEIQKAALARTVALTALAPIKLDDDDDVDIVSSTPAPQRRIQYASQSHPQLVLACVTKDDAIDKARSESRQWRQKYYKTRTHLDTLVARHDEEKVERETKSNLAICHVGTKERSEWRESRNACRL